MDEKILKYMEQDIDHPIYLFHGSCEKIDKVIPHLSHDSDGSSHNIDNAIFLFPSFLKSTPYAFMNSIIENSENQDWDFEVPNDSSYPIMRMTNVNIDEDMVGYIYVFKKEEDMYKDEEHKSSYQYKCYHELIPIDVVEIRFKDFEQYYEIVNRANSKKV